MLATSLTPVTNEPRELSFLDWLAEFRHVWKQGEHVAIIGQTGSGKTTVARDVLRIRTYVIVLAVKRKDDTLATFPRAGYKTVKKWPIDWHINRALLTLPPESLKDTEQSTKVYAVLNGAYKSGNWCIFIDDTGYVTGILGLKRQVATLLSQGRSNGNSIVTAMTQPSSVAQGVPSEVLRQVRHVLFYHYEDKRDIEAIARITGLDNDTVSDLSYRLGEHDFLAYRRNGGYSGITIVRNTR